MATLQDVEIKLQQDPAFIGNLLVNPKIALLEAEISLTNPNDARRLESLVRGVQKDLKVAGELASFNPSASADWGIGFGCCNSNCLTQYNTTGACSGS